MATEGSYFSRAFLKFIEVVAAGVATAVSGYLIAHLGGFLPTTTTQQAAAPPAVQASAPASLPSAPAATAAHPASAPARKTAAAESGAAESKPRETESVEAKVRAALAKAEAKPPAPRGPAPQPADRDVTGSVAAPAALPRPLEATAAVPPTPRSADVTPAPQTTIQPAPQATPLPAPLTTVDIPSHPVATAPADQAGAPETTQASAGDDNGPSLLSDLLAPFKKLPNVLRNDAPASDAPRPPAPVGQ